MMGWRQPVAGAASARYTGAARAASLRLPGRLPSVDAPSAPARLVGFANLLVLARSGRGVRVP